MSVGSAVEIRRFRLGDVRRVHELEEEIYSAPWRYQHFLQLLALPNGIGWVAEEEGRVVGYALGWLAADEAELANIAVDEGRRGRGIGRRLLETFVEGVRDRGTLRLYLEVRESNELARDFYLGHGFEVVGRRPDYYDSPPEDAVQMARDLEPDSG
ncbi:MAG: ribosomal protein S18-alanine N-acetyltransferase [Gemmatimonadota bacterium]|nr:ribosomal protein S18-alanine N-acetyltransferase [Gemmatimonadota bacterium]